MVILRFIFGVCLGFLATSLMWTADLLRLAPDSELRRDAIVCVWLMYSLGTGIDEGASTIIEEWGSAGRRSVRLLRAQGRLPRPVEHRIYIFHLDDDADAPTNAG